MAKGNFKRNDNPIPVITDANTILNSFYGSLAPEAGRMIINTGIPLRGSVDIYRNLELSEDIKSSLQPSMLNYNQTAQIVLDISLSRDGTQTVRGVELYEKKPLIDVGGARHIGSEKIVGEKTTTKTVALNPLQIVQGNGVAIGDQAVENGAYNFAFHTIDRDNIDGAQHISPDVAHSLTLQRRELGQSGLMVAMTPFEISLMVEQEDEIASLMRNNPGFLETDAGKLAINSYFQNQLASYAEIHQEKFPISSVVATDRPYEIASKLKMEFSDVTADPAWINACSENRNEVKLVLAQYKVAAYTEELNGGKYLRPEMAARAEEEIKYYNRYIHFAELNARWDSRMLEPIRKSSDDVFTIEEKKQKEGYLSVQNGYTSSHFEQLQQAFDTITLNMQKELAIVDNENNSAINKDRLDVYTQQLSYLEEMIRNHPENPLNKPLMPIDSSINPTVQRVDSTLQARMEAYNKTAIVRDDYNMELTMAILADRTRCQNFINEHKDNPNKDIQEGIAIAKQAIANNTYRISYDRFNEFTDRTNKQKIIDAIVESQTNVDGKAPFKYEELVNAYTVDPSGNTLRTLMCGKLGIDYSSSSLDGFFRSPDLQAALRNPEFRDKDRELEYLKSPLIYNGNKFRDISDLSDPQKCQEIKARLIENMQRIEDLNKKAGYVRVSVETIRADLDFIDKHIIENRMDITKEQRLVNNYQFDNIYAISLTQEDIKRIENSPYLDSHNTERYRDPAYVQRALSELVDRIEREQRAIIPQEPARDKEEQAERDKELQVQIDKVVNSNPDVQYLRELLTPMRELEYKDTDIPQSTLDRIALRNEMVEYARDNPKKSSLEDLKNEFGDREHFESLVKGSLSMAIESKTLQDESIQCATMNDVLEKIDVYNRLVSAQGTSLSKIDDDLANNPYAYEFLHDKQFKTAFKEGSLKPVEIPVHGQTEFSTDNPLHCYITSEALKASGNPYASMLGYDMSTTMSFMENEAMKRTIFHNCQEVLSQRDLSPAEVEALKVAAMDKLEVCTVKDMATGKFETGEFNRQLSELQGKLEPMFSAEGLAHQREQYVSTHMDQAVAYADKIETNLKEFYNLHHVAIQETEIKNDKEQPTVSSADIIARAQMRQLTSDPQSSYTAENEIMTKLHENKFYVEYQKVAGLQSEIDKCDEQIYRINHPQNAASSDVLRTYVEEHVPGRFDKRNLWERESAELQRRDDAVARLELQKDQLRAQSFLGSEISGTTPSEKMDDYINKVIQPRVIESQSLVDAYSKMGTPEEFASARLESLRNLGMDSTVCDRYQQIMENNDLHKELKTAAIRGDELSSVDKTALRLLDESYTSLSRREGLTIAERELASVQSDLESAKEFKCLMAVSEATKEFHSLTYGVTAQELETRMTHEYGPYEADHVSIARDKVELNIPDSKELSKTIEYLNDNEKFITMINDKLADGSGNPVVLSKDESSGLNTYLQKYSEYQEMVSNPTISSARIGALNMSEDEFYKREPVLVDGVDQRGISNDDLVAATAADRILPQNIKEYYEEHKEEITNNVHRDIEIEGEEASNKDFTSEKKQSALDVVENEDVVDKDKVDENAFTLGDGVMEIDDEF